MKACVRKLKQFYKKDSYDNILKILFLVLNTLNLCLCINTKLCVPITIGIFLFYLKVSNISKKKKYILVLTWFTFSILTIYGESVIISLNSGNSLNYNLSDLHNVSSWLFSAYASMCIGTLLIYDYYNTIL